MSNLLADALASVLKSFTDAEPKPPLHVGEVMNCWTILAAIEEATIFVEMADNTTSDPELKELIHQAEQLCSKHIQKLKQFMMNEGVSLPPVSEQKPKCSSEEIPPGAKMTDDEIANGISLKFAALFTAGATAVIQSIRNDYSLMFLTFMTEEATYGSTLKATMKKRGWLKIPPYYTPSGRPQS